MERLFRWFGPVALWVATGALVLASGGCEQCEAVDGLFEVYREASIYPEDFDSWLAANESRFTNEMLRCIDDSAERIAAEGDRLRRRCDQTFVQGSEFWHQCYDEVSDDAASLLEAIGLAARGQSRFDQTAYGFGLIASKELVGAAEYESALMSVYDALGDQLRESLACEYCERNYLLF